MNSSLFAYAEGGPRLVRKQATRALRQGSQDPRPSAVCERREWRSIRPLPVRYCGPSLTCVGAACAWIRVDAFGHANMRDGARRWSSKATWVTP